MDAMSLPSSDLPSTIRPRLLVDLGALLYVGPGFDAEAHAHHAVQLVLAFDGEVTLEQGGCARVVRASLVPSDVTHQLTARGRHIALLLIDRETPSGAALDSLAQRREGLDLAAELALEPPPRRASQDVITAWARELLAKLLRPGGDTRPLSDPVRASLAYVQRELEGRPRLDAAARAAGVSPSHLTHVFTAEVGLPFRRYVLWARSIRAIDAVRRGASLTEAAIRAGFSDSAHFSRTFRRTFGRPPSSFLDAEIASSAGIAETFKPRLR